MEEVKDYLKKYFVTKDMGWPRYFLGIGLSNKILLCLKGSMHLNFYKKLEYVVAILKALLWSPLWLLEWRWINKTLTSRPFIFKCHKTWYSIFCGTYKSIVLKPKVVHWRATLRILVYIQKSPWKGLWYRNNEHLNAEAYPNSGFAGDRVRRKSTSVIVSMLVKTWWA